MSTVRHAFLIMFLALSLLQPAVAQVLEQENLGLVSQHFLDRFFDRLPDLNFHNYSPRALSLGGAYVATADDPTAIFVNPAGLANLDRRSVGVVLRFNSNSRVYDTPQLAGLAVTSEEDPRITPDFVSLVWPTRLASRNVAVSVGYRTLNNMLREVKDTHHLYGGGLFAETTKSTGGSSAVFASGAVELISNLSVGLTYDRVIGNSKLNMDVGVPFFTIPDLFVFEDKETYSGGFITAGLLYKMGRLASLGIRVTPGWTYGITEELEEIGFRQSQTEDLQRLDTPSDSLDVFDLNIPLSLGVGLHVNPFRSLILEFEYRRTAWSEATMQVNSKEADLPLDDVISYHVGLAYSFPTAWGDLPLRVGYARIPLPYRDKYFRGDFLGEQLEERLVSVGGSFRIKALSFDLAFVRATSTRHWWLDAGDYYNDRIYSTEERFNQFVLSTVYGF